MDFIPHNDHEQQRAAVRNDEAETVAFAMTLVAHLSQPSREDAA